MRKAINIMVQAGLAASLLASCSTQISQDSFAPRPGALAPPGELIAPPGYSLSHTLLAVGDLGVVNAAFLDNPASDTVIIYHGGNGSFVSTGSKTAGALALATQADLILYDYPERGGTTVPATIDASIAVGAPMIAALKSKGWIGKGPVFNYGFSFGGSQAAAMARNGGFAGLIIEGSAPDYLGIGKDFVPGIAKPFVKLRVDPELKKFDYLGYVKVSNAPVLLIAGEADTVVRPKRVQEFSAALKADGPPTTLINVPGGHGAALTQPAGSEAVRSFVQAHSK